jgi:hypothetical protein
VDVHPHHTSTQGVLRPLREGFQMTAIDWHEIIAVATDRDEWVYGHSPDHDEVADCVLAARVPQACPTCEGSGHLGPATGSPQRDYGRACPDCPTVAKLLAIGAAVMTDAIPAQPGFMPPQGQAWGWYIEGWNDATAALRAVEP